MDNAVLPEDPGRNNTYLEGPSLPIESGLEVSSIVTPAVEVQPPLEPSLAVSCSAPSVPSHGDRTFCIAERSVTALTLDPCAGVGLYSTATDFSPPPGTPSMSSTPKGCPGIVGLCLLAYDLGKACTAS